jgi:hypothetical protein
MGLEEVPLGVLIELKLYLGPLIDGANHWWQTCGMSMPEAAIKYKDVHDTAHLMGYFPDHWMPHLIDLIYN